jgi:dipeptidyl aminopeptidase/acylaminoacyl peptidase
MSAVDAAIAKGFVDSHNLFVTGGSGGGVLTAWIVGKNDRFRAAATQKPVIDWPASPSPRTARPITTATGSTSCRGKTRRVWRVSPLSLVAT